MLTVHRAAGGTALAAGLAALLRTPPDDPFTPDVVAVPAKGVERWLAQRLSHVLGTSPDGGDGVCANVRFENPAVLLDAAIATASPEHAAAVGRWAPERVTWTVVEVIDASLGEAWCATLAHHLRGPADEDLGRRVAVAGRLARLFDSYATSRPELLLAWAGGRDETGAGDPLPADLHWQAELWRRVRDRLRTPSPAELLDAACAHLRAAPDAVPLPARLSVFGASRLPVARLRALAALAAGRDVHLWLHHASPALWAAGIAAPPAVRRAEDETRRVLRNPLLASLSRDVLELQQLLRRHAPDAADVHHEDDEVAAGTLLQRLQRDLATDDVPAAPAPLAADDRSVQIHSCHGRTRQVEVLREVVLGLLADDPALEPRDVLVMCPDVETFAPLIAAAFSLGAGEDAPHPAARLWVRLADRALRQVNPLLDVLSRLLELGVARVTASEVLDLAGHAAVRERFGFTDDEVERLTSWVAGTGARWGMDGEHRRDWQLGGVAAGTWRAGLDRLLLGVTMASETEDVGGVLPFDDVDSADVDLAGRFAELVDRIAAALDLLGGRHPVAAWVTGLETAVLGLAATPRREAWQQVQLRAELADVAAAGSASDVRLGLADVRALLEPVLAGRPTRASFRTGTLTVCTLVPMRSVPHRVVCLLGLDDGTFPRQTVRDGEDALARDPWIGERDPRSEDRQLLLDAICAAREHLVVTYAGADERTGASVPPAVPLGEVLDALDRTATAPDGARVRDVVTVRHPLQPFDSRNFTPGELGRPGPFSFDRLTRDGAIAAAAERLPGNGFLPVPLPRRPRVDVELADLHKLLQHPARGFLRQRLQVAAIHPGDDPDDALDVELNHLQRWAIGERVLAARIAGLSPRECTEVELRRGLLPPGALGDREMAVIGPGADAVLAASAGERALPPEAHDVDVRLPDGTRLTGTVRGVHGDVVLSATYSKLAAKHRLQAWVDVVTLTCAVPGRSWQAIAVGRAPKDGALRSVFGPLSPDDAHAAIGELVALYRTGLLGPLPLALKTGAAYADKRRRGMPVPSARNVAIEEWREKQLNGGQWTRAERQDDEHVLVHGVAAPFDVLLAEPPAADEDGAGWAADEADRFGRLARRLWERLLAAERQEQR